MTYIYKSKTIKMNILSQKNKLKCHIAQIQADNQAEAYNGSPQSRRLKSTRSAQLTLLRKKLDILNEEDGTTTFLFGQVNPDLYAIQDLISDRLNLV